MVDIEPATPVGTFCQTLARWVGRHAPVPESPGLAVWSEAGPRLLDPVAAVYEAGLVSGQVVYLVDGQGVAPTPPARSREKAHAVALDITSGPDVGRSIVLPPGTHAVGRAPTCEVAVDDPLMSRHHFTVTVSESLNVVIDPNPQAANGTLLGGQWIDGRRDFPSEEGLLAGGTQFVLRPVETARAPRRDRLGQVSFNRLPYRRPIIRERRLEALTLPPEKPRPHSFPVVAMVVPLVAGVAFAVLLGEYLFLLMAALSPIMLASNYLSDRRKARGTQAGDRAEFRERLNRLAGEIDAGLAAERAERLAAAPDLPLLARQAAGRQYRLWERPRGTPDFLELRIGLGEQRSRVLTEVAPGGDTELRAEAEQRLAGHDRLPHVPVTAPLNDAGVAGLYGEAAPSLAAALVVQAATLHSPEDLVITAAMPDGTRDWNWLKWLPHCRSATSPLDGPHLVTNAGVDDLVRRLMNVIADRQGQAGWPRVLLLIHEHTGVNRAHLATLLDNAGAAGIVTLWVGSAQAEMPRQCRLLLRCVEPGPGPSVLTFTDPTLDDTPFQLEGIDSQTAERIARDLAPLRDVSASSVTTGIPRTVALFDLPGLCPQNEADLAARWKLAQPYALACTLGIGVDGPFSVDLVSEGPHVLIGGTSGSGKSELLQTLVLALALRYPPRRLNFLFIDYKGGASTTAFGALPHTVGSVTNLDQRLALRALRSLQAELRRRMAILEGQAKDLAEMLERKPEEAPPSLILVVDEFATLVKEIPDFVAGIVDIAQRGRSLGIHLVLATQRPAGAVNDNILANTNLRIALRVLAPEDSTSIVGGAEAASIPVPLRGRAYARTGPGARVAFQCAWSGASAAPGGARPSVLLRPYTFPPGAPPQATSPQATPGDPNSGLGTQLDAAVALAARAFALSRESPPRRPWVEALPPVVVLEPLLAEAAASGPRRTAARNADPGRAAVLGLADLPDEQRRSAFQVDLEASGGLLVLGTGGCGKTTLLRTLAAGLALQGTPEEVRIHVLDFSGRSLLHLACLPHVVDAVSGDDPERVARMLTLLRNELDRRRTLLSDAQAETVSALRATRPAAELPRLILLLDNYEAFHQAFESGPRYPWLNEFQRLVIDGRQVGIHTVITNTRQLGIPTVVTSSIGARIIMRMASPDDLMSHGVPRPLALGAELSPGRCLTNDNVELHIATVSPDPSAASQVAAVAALAERVSGTGPTPGLPELPSLVPLGTARGATGPLAARAAGLEATLGLADLSLSQVSVDLSHQNFVVVGPPRSGRSTALATIALGLEGCPRVGLGSLTSPLAGLGCWDIAGFGRSRHVPALEAAARLVDGYEGNEVLAIVALDAVEDLDAMEYGPWLDRLLRSDAVRVLATADSGTLERAYSGWMTALKRGRAVLVLQPSGAAEVEAQVGVKPPLRPGQAFPPGRGVLVDRGLPTLIQVFAPDLAAAASATTT